MTGPQTAWLSAHPDYQQVGRPSPHARFIECGTLYPDGSFEKMAPMKPVILVAGPPYAICVGIKVHAHT